MTTPNLFTSSAPAQSYTALNGGMDGADQTGGQALFQQASQSHQPDVLVKRQFEQRNQNQKSKLANEFVASAGREGISQLAATPDGQHALAVVYDHAGSDGRGLMRQVHEEQGSTAVDYTPESGLVCTAQVAQQGEKAPEEQYLDKLMKQYADHTSGEMPLPSSESLGLRSEIERVSEIFNPGQQNMWGEYTPQEKQYLEEQALRERQVANSLGMWVGGPVFSAMPATARLLGAPEPVVEGFGQINAEIAGGKAFGRQGRGIESVRTPIIGGPVNTYVLDTKSVRIERPGSMVLGKGVSTDKIDPKVLSKDAPISIPESAKINGPQNKAAGYKQVSYKWDEEIAGRNNRFEARWHEPTPNSPEGTVSNWRVTRTLSGSPDGSFKKEVYELVRGDGNSNLWIPERQFRAATRAWSDGTATREQVDLLKRAHFE